MPTIADLQQRTHDILQAKPPAGWAPSGIDRSGYLTVIEDILTIAAKWQDSSGAIIDPVIGKEHGQTSCRFVAPGAVLLSAGRGGHLRENVLRGMTYCCRQLAIGKGDSPDFWMRELITAYVALQGSDDPRRAEWERDLRSIDPEKIYTNVSPDGSRLNELHNWTIYAAAGESLRAQAHLGPQPDDPAIIWGERFFAKYMPPQLAHFNDYGMYRDPNDPFTYDMTTRLQITVAIHSAARSPLHEQFDELLRRGALAQLLYVSPAGYAPFGGRSNQLHVQEAILTALCEYEATLYRTSDPALASAFKRQAHLHLTSILRWLKMTPMRHIKNAFDPATHHGCEKYAQYSVYSLFTASCLALAWQFADDRIAEMPAPAETGGYVLELQPAFHKVFATCGGTQLEIDTAADPHYDATGLGRFLLAGVPLELGLAMPIPSHPNYHIPADMLPATDIAIGPGWKTADGKWVDLAAIHDGLTAEVMVEATSPSSLSEIALSVHWRHASSGLSLRQHYHLTAGTLRINAEILSPDVTEMRFTIPLLSSDGATTTRIAQSPGQAVVTHPQGVYRVEFVPSDAVSLGKPVANRNGLYQPLIIEWPANHIEVTLSLARA